MVDRVVARRAGGLARVVVGPCCQATLPPVQLDRVDRSPASRTRRRTSCRAWSCGRWIAGRRRGALPRRCPGGPRRCRRARSGSSSRSSTACGARRLLPWRATAARRASRSSAGPSTVQLTVARCQPQRPGHGIAALVERPLTARVGGVDRRPEIQAIAPVRVTTSARALSGAPSTTFVLRAAEVRHVERRELASVSGSTARGTSRRTPCASHATKRPFSRTMS